MIYYMISHLPCGGHLNPKGGVGTPQPCEAEHRGLWESPQQHNRDTTHVVVVGTRAAREWNGMLLYTQLKKNQA